MGLGQEDIELDDGVPAPIEQPTAIVPRPLSMDDQDDRVRMVFGLTHDDLLPDVNEENQHAYDRYLLAHLTLPFRAQYRPGGIRAVLRQDPSRLTVTGLVRSRSITRSRGIRADRRGQGTGRAGRVPADEIEASRTRRTAG